MASSPVLDKILQLEKEIIELKQQLAPEPKGIRKLIVRIKALTAAVTANWVILAVLAGLFLNWWYEVDFFHTVKNIGITKKSAEYYRLLGDNLVEHAEFQAAADAYSRALLINPNNISATHGLMKAEVLEPIGDGQKYSPVAAEAKIRYLRENIFRDDDYVLTYWEGLLKRNQSENQQDLGAAEKLFQRSIDQASAKQQNFVGSHFELANTFLLNGKIADAYDKYKEVVSKDAKSAAASAGLGYCSIVLATFEGDSAKRKQLLRGAVTALDRSVAIMQRPETHLILGDAYVYQKQYSAALRSHENAIDSANASQKESPNRALDITYVFLPETPSDKRITGPGISVTTFTELQMFARYALAFDHALLGKFHRADRQFETAKGFDPNGNYNAFFANKIFCLSNLAAPTRRTRRWFQTKIDTLCKDREGCKPSALDRKQKEKDHGQ